MSHVRYVCIGLYPSSKQVIHTDAINAALRAHIARLTSQNASMSRVGISEFDEPQLMLPLRGICEHGDPLCSTILREAHKSKEGISTNQVARIWCVLIRYLRVHRPTWNLNVIL